MTAAEIPKAYDRLLQRLIKDQDSAAVIPPFLYLHSVIIRASKNCFSPIAWKEEFFRGIRRRQPNSLRWRFCGVEGVLQELENLSDSDLRALAVCNSSNRQKHERTLKIRWWSLVSAAAAGLSSLGTWLQKLGFDITALQSEPARSLIICAISGALLAAALVWYSSGPIIGRLEVFSDLLAIALEKASKARPPEMTPAAEARSSQPKT